MIPPTERPSAHYVDSPARLVTESIPIPAEISEALRDGTTRKIGRYYAGVVEVLDYGGASGTLAFFPNVPPDEVGEPD